MRKSMMKGCAFGLFAGLMMSLLGGCVGAEEPVGEPEPEVVWDEAAQQCYLRGAPVTVNGESSEAGCDALGEAAGSGTLSADDEAAYPGLSPQGLCCAEVCNCWPGGCECSGMICVRCAV